MQAMVDVLEGMAVWMAGRVTEVVGGVGQTRGVDETAIGFAAAAGAGVGLGRGAL